MAAEDALRLLVLLTGPFAGSAAALLADRLPRGEAVVFARSRCRACGRRLGPAELVPLLSWLALGGRCRGCGAQVPGWLVGAELAGAALGAGAALLARSGAEAAAGAAFLWCLLALALADLRRFLLPRPLTTALLAVGTGAAAAAPGALAPGAAAATLGTAALGAAAGAGAFWAVGAAYRLRTGRVGLGGGDVALMAGVGAGLGPLALPAVALLGSTLGLGFAACRARRRGRQLRAHGRVPFGAALALAAMLVWVGQRLGATP